MQIAITGASGRVGRRVVDAASRRDHSVVAIDRTDVSEFESGVQVDLRDYDTVVAALKGCDALIHLAGIPGPGFLPDHIVHDNNVLGSYHALRAAVEVGIERVAQASSVNAIGGRFSASPRYDYFPLDELHASYAEDAYSLSKWICEQQADAVARAHPGTSIASLRLHGTVEDRADATAWIGIEDGIEDGIVRHLWGYTTYAAAARAFVLAVETELGGHEVFYVVAPETMVDTPSIELATRYYPDVEQRADLPGTTGFFDCSKANRMLAWRHDEE